MDVASIDGFVLMFAFQPAPASSRSHDAPWSVGRKSRAQLHCGSGQRSCGVCPVCTTAVDLLAVWRSLQTGVLSALMCSYNSMCPLVSISCVSLSLSVLLQLSVSLCLIGFSVQSKVRTVPQRVPYTFHRELFCCSCSCWMDDR